MILQSHVELIPTVPPFLAKMCASKIKTEEKLVSLQHLKSCVQKKSLWMKRIVALNQVKGVDKKNITFKFMFNHILVMKLQIFKILLPPN